MSAKFILTQLRSSNYKQFLLIVCIVLLGAVLVLNYNDRTGRIANKNWYELVYTTINTSKDVNTGQMLQTTIPKKTSTTCATLELPKEEIQIFNPVVNDSKVINKNQTKNILYWDTFWGDHRMNLGLGSDIFKSCPVTTCFATHNHTYMPEENFDAVVFHGARWNSTADGKPAKRNLNQKYIFFSWESPFNTLFDKYPNEIRNYFNWTLTYRRDSDIKYPYGLIRKNITDYKLPTVEEIKKNKTVMAAWMVTNCYTEGTKRRKEYVAELRKYIDIDIYGGCGNMTCMYNCTDIIHEKYYFYLAFENSMCQDYVTEKVYANIQLNVIPIVLGINDYKLFAPPHSVIDIKDFATPKLLAEYLHKLTNNLTLYLEYFQWKKNYIVVNTKEYALCQLCTMLHEPIQYSNYEDIKKWYFGYNCYV